MTERARIFEFALEDVTEREPLYDDRVTEFFRQQILNLLDVAVLTRDGVELRPDGFSFVADRDRVFALWRRSSSQTDGIAQNASTTQQGEHSAEKPLND